MSEDSLQTRETMLRGLMREKERQNALNDAIAACERKCSAVVHWNEHDVGFENGVQACIAAIEALKI